MTSTVLLIDSPVFVIRLKNFPFILLLLLLTCTTYFPPLIVTTVTFQCSPICRKLLLFLERLLCFVCFFALLCDSQALSWSGSHRANSGEELFYTQSRLTVMGRPQLCSLTITLTDSSTAHGSNLSLFSEVQPQQPSGDLLSVMYLLKPIKSHIPQALLLADLCRICVLCAELHNTEGKMHVLLDGRPLQLVVMWKDDHLMAIIVMILASK